MNNLSSPDQMRILLKRMRGEKYEINESKDQKKKDLTMRDMLKITRNINEQVEDTQTAEPTPDTENKEAVNKETVYDQKEEEEKLLKLFGDTVSISFDDLEVYDDWVFWTGIINGVLQFAFVVTRDEITSTVEFNQLEGFSKDNPANDEIMDKIEKYYEATFAPYWRQVIQK